MAVEILAEWGEKLDCHTCDDRLKEERGHYKEGIIPYMVDKKRVFRCPLMLITPLTYEYLKAYNFYEKRSYPNGVAWSHEGNKYIQAMMILDKQFSKDRNKKTKA